MTEPRTEAGKRLNIAWPGSHIDRLDWQERIAAIEAEARAAVLIELREAVEGIRPPDRFVATDGTYEQGLSEAAVLRAIDRMLGEEAMTRAIEVHVPCTICGDDVWDHRHQPLPCENGAPEKHHPCAPPEFVTLLIAGQRHRVRLSR